MLIIDAAEENHTDDLNRKKSHELEKYVSDYLAFSDSGFANANNLINELTDIGNQLNELKVEGALQTVETIREKLAKTIQDSQTRKAEFETLKHKINEDEQLCKRFAESAQNFFSFLEVQKEKSSSATGDNLEETINILQQVQTILESRGKELIEEIEFLSGNINSRNILENPFSSYSARSLKTNYESFLVQNSKKLLDAKDQLESKNQSGITSDEYSDIKESFEYFDKDKDGKLNALDFFGVLKFLGENFTEQGAQELLNQLDIDNDGLLNFDEYKKYIVNKRSDKDTAEAYAQAFEIIAGGRPFVTEEELRRSGMPNDRIEHLKKVIPIKEGLEGIVGYDYKTWLTTIH